MTLTKEQQALREGRLTASRIAVLMTGDKEKILDLWKELVGDPSWVKPDFSDNWPVCFGEATEEINLAWFAKKHGEVTRRGDVVYPKDPTAPFAATLDGWSVQHKCPIECKTVGGFEKLSAVIERYQPQMQFQMELTGAKQCAFSVIEGGREPIVEFIQIDTQYVIEMFNRAALFMQHVFDITPPVVLDPVAPPVKATKEYDFTQNNMWCNLAHDFSKTHMDASIHEKAKAELKKLVPADAVRVYGGGIEATRDRANRLKITGI
jgi:predicted phage-related endonuclease